MTKKLLFILVFIAQLAIAQTPQSFKYQAVVRDAAGTLAVNRVVSFRNSILAGSAGGSSVYTESQTLTTNDYGVVNLNIGAGTVVSGNFGTISWGSNVYFIKTELDINGGSNYQFMGSSQILSVPYALYAEKTGSSIADHDTSATNEIQTLAVTGSNLSISNGNTIVLPPDADNDITNELQTLSILGDSLFISNKNAVYLSGSIDLDASPSNEIQSLSYNNDTIKLSLSNQIILPSDYDKDTLNEIQTLSINQGSIKISEANTIHLPDSSSTNELQNIAINQGTISISNGNSIQLPDSSSVNEIQTLSINNDSISISQGNAVYINTTKSLQFPEGIEGSEVFFTGGFPNYTVPNGYNLYITVFSNSGIDNTNGYTYECNFGLPVIKEGSTINGGGLVSGILAPKDPTINVVEILLTNTNSYTVPANKYLYIKSLRDVININGVGYNFTSKGSYALPIILSPGTVISKPSGTTFSEIITGYYK